MAEEIRRSKREVKIKKSSDYYYEEGVLEALAPRNTGRSNTWQHRNCDSAKTPTELASEAGLASVRSSSVWSENLKFPIFNVIEESAHEYFSLSAQDYISYSEVPSQSQVRNSAAAGACAIAPEKVNKYSGESERERLNSSTAEGFLDLEGNFFSADTAIMSTSEGSDIPLETAADNSPNAVPASDVELALDGGLASAIFSTLGKMEQLTEEVQDLKRLLVSNSRRLNQVELKQAVELGARGQDSTRSKVCESAQRPEFASDASRLV